MEATCVGFQLNFRPTYLSQQFRDSSSSPIVYGGQQQAKWSSTFKQSGVNGVNVKPLLQLARKIESLSRICQRRVSASSRREARRSTGSENGSLAGKNESFTGLPSLGDETTFAIQCCKKITEVEEQDPLKGEVGPSDSADVEKRGISPFQDPSRVGVLITAGHFLVAVSALVLLDVHNVKTSPHSFASFNLTAPFLQSAAVTALVGYGFVPFLKYLKVFQIFRKEGPSSHHIKIGTPTMGGLFFVPIGLAIAGVFTGFKSAEVQAVTTVTLAFAGIGLMDDVLAFWQNHNSGLPGRMKFFLQVVVGTGFCFWLEFADLSSPHRMKHAVWLPIPFRRILLGKFYLPLTVFCCAAMSNGVNLTDGLDGLAGGTAGAAFLGMSFAVLFSFPTLGVFGASMAGACYGFLVHNRFIAKVFMGDTGSLALGGALAAMAAYSGMFFPLFIASGVFVIETVSVICQVSYFKFTKRMYGQSRRLFLMAPFHHHMELLGMREPVIILWAYIVGNALAILAAYLVLACS